MRKLLPLVALVTGVSALVASCAGGSAEPAAPDDAATDGGDAPMSGVTPECEAATIEIWGYGEENVPWVQRANEAFAEKYPEASVKWSYVPYDTILSKLLGTALAGDGPDGIYYNPADSARLYEAGVIGDMSQIWEEYEGSDEFAESTVWRSGDAVVSVQGYVNITALYYNQTILDELGLQPPTTVDEMEDVMAAAKDAGYDGLTISAQPNGQGEFLFFPWLLGEGQNYGSWDQDAVASVFERFKGWIDAGYISPDAVSWDINNAYDKWTAGNTVFTHNGNWNLVSIQETVDFDWGVVELPAGTSGSHSVGGGEGVSIGANAECPGLVFDWFDMALLSTDAQEAILSDQGSIPSRADAAADAVTEDPSLQVFAQVVENSVARPNSAKIGDYLTTMGEIWNAVAGGQLSPDEGAARVVAELSEL